MSRLTPYAATDAARIYHGDALTVLSELAEPVDVVIADPPYSSGGRTSSERTSRSTVEKYQSTDATTFHPDFLGDTRDQHSHAHWCALWLAQCHRLAREGAVCFVWSDWRQLAATTDALQAGGWVWRGVVVWRKRGSRPARGRFRLDVEYAVWGSKGPMPVHQLVYPSSVIEAAPPKQRKHIAQKPVDVYAHLLQVAPRHSVVLDPFTGTGTALEAAIAGEHTAIGIELDEHYCRVAADRIASLERGTPAAGGSADT